jgi:hypothetical protein
MRVIHHRDVRPETLTRYSRVVTRLVLLVLRCYRGGDCEYSMTLTKEQSGACRALLETLSTSELEPELHPGVTGIDDFDDLDCSEGPSDDPDDEVYEDVQALFEDASPFSPGLEHDTIAENALQSDILDLLLLLYTHLPTGRDDKFWSPIMRFIVLFSRRENGKWLSTRQITQIFAALLFCGRLLMMVLMHRNVLSNPEVRYSAYVGTPHL